MLPKLTAVKKFVAVNPKKTTMKSSPTTIGTIPMFPVRTFSVDALEEAGGPPPRRPAQASRDDGFGRAHAGVSPVAGMPGDLRRDAGGDRRDDLLLRGLLALEHADIPSEPEHRDPVRRLEDVVEVVRDDDHGEALLAEAPHECEHLLGLRDSERRGRLVEDHELGVPLDGLRDRYRLPLAARERCDRPQDRRNRRDGERLQRRRPCALPSRPRSGPASGSDSRPRYMFWTTSRLSQRARSW